LLAAAERLTLAEQRIVLAAIAQTRRDAMLTDEAMYSVTANVMGDLPELATDDAYRALREAARRLARRQVRVRLAPPLGGKRDAYLRWVQRVDYINDEGRVEIRFGRELLPYLAALKQRFATYRQQQSVRMSTRYADRLYTLLLQWQGVGEREVAIDELRELLELGGKYQAPTDLKRRVLEPAVRDINAATDLWVRLGTRRVGRKIFAFQFQFGPKSAAETAPPPAPGPYRSARPTANTTAGSWASPEQRAQAAQRLRRIKETRRVPLAPATEPPPAANDQPSWASAEEREEAARHLEEMRERLGPAKRRG